MQAFSRWIWLRVYLDSNVALPGPVLDLGCGDAAIAAMLREGGVLEERAVGLDRSRAELRKAQRRGEHRALIEGDANRLPFRDGAFGSVVCNDVLGSMPGGADQALREVARVVRSGGVVVATLPTDRFLEVLSIPKVIAPLSRRVAAWYITRLRERVALHTAHTVGEWIRRFEASNFEVVKSEQFLTPHAGAVWNILSMQIFRVFAVLKVVKARLVAAPLRALFRAVYRERVVDPPGGGFVFLVARKI
jgi:ubiquinone/menaquinone biosynthesis C-methylase UbiE